MSLAISISFATTFLAFLLGHLAEPAHWMPQTLQMLVANVVFDGATFLITVYLLEWSVRRRPMLRIPVAICADIGLAALFASLSLFCGLVLSDHQLSPTQVLNVLIGRAPQGSAFEIGPYFWAMHTAFLPTLLYVAVILVAWLGKSILLPVEMFLGMGRTHKNPLKLTAALVAVVALVFTAMSFASGSAQEYADQKNKKTSQENLPSLTPSGPTAQP